MDNKQADQSITALLHFIRAATCWSEPRIAKKLGVSQPTVNRILNGQGDCKGSTLQAIRALHQQVALQLAQQREASRPDTDTSGAAAPSFPPQRQD